ncbi:unnamed protein product, partial [Rotaria sordida]
MQFYMNFGPARWHSCGKSVVTSNGKGSGTTDFGAYCFSPDLAIQHCRILIERIRQLFPRLQPIGWLALPPRWKPSKLFNDLEINENNCKFNQHLQILSKEMNFEIIDAGLQQHHMHRDGLHP